MTAKTTTTITKYVWARTEEDARGLLALPRDQAARYATEEAALAAKGRGDDGFPGEELWPIPVEVES